MQHPRHARMLLCPECGDTVVAASKPASSAPPAPAPTEQPQSPFQEAPKRDRGGMRPTKSFWAELPLAPVFVFANGGWLMLIILCLFILLVRMASGCGILGLIAYIIGTGMFMGYGMHVIRASAAGEGSLPGWQDIEDFFSGGLVPFFQVLVLVLICFSPAMILIGLEFETAGVLVGVVGLFLLPMTWLSVAMDMSLSGLNPVRIGASVMRTLVSYTSLCVIVFALGALPVVMSLDPNDLALALAAIPIEIYVFVIWMHLLGRFYHHHHDQLGWYEF